jgi:hypothetical protein
LARHGRSKRAPLRLCRPQQRSGDDIHDHARREARWASRRHEHLRMLVGPKCGAHIPCGPSFDGPDCASAHDRRIAVTGLGGGGQQRGCEGPANRAGLAQAIRTHGPLYSSSIRPSQQDSLLYTQFSRTHPSSISSSIHSIYCGTHLSLYLNISMSDLVLKDLLRRI